MTRAKRWPARRVVAAVTAALLACGCSAATRDAGGTAGGSDHPATIKAPTPALQPFYSQKPAWNDCGDGFQCARIQVPLDYDKPSGERIEVSAIRLRATGTRVGSLLINPGGPGGSGIQYTRSARALFPDGIRSRFDIVGFDPRGVGESTPVRCMTSKQLDAFVSLDASPDTPEELTTLERESKGFADDCEAKSGHLLPHVGTADAARDMDVLRAVVGDTKLTYLGKSYGTYLGAVYADLFPKQVRALVLDGAVDPAVPSLKANEVQAQGFEVALKAFLEDCFQDGACPFTSRTVDGAMAEVSALLKKADEHPLKNDLGDGRQVNEAWTTLGIVTPLYERDAWPRLRAAFGHAFNGNGTDLLRMADILVDRHQDGTYSNQTESNMAINCLDHPFPKDPGEYKRAAGEAARVAPQFGSFVMYGSLPCAYWPVESKGTDKPLKAAGAPPILVVGTIRDPATPYEWAKGLASELSSGVLLGFDGDGHTGYRSGSTCVDSAVDGYLISLRVPKNGTVCPKIG
ncbi:alpha/beta hydrolase [Microbispora sp. ATCC PTA-5024]|uniref:alpha/beta hydrolase n=1 Tax=Microbispora sp. ATCC PTA-5024 TaxID=316330 RepID=UPI0003DC11F4|nr:alpha/beta hydrolase [Microbispora sp. ATCC PTA-5024]ETK35322.1 peptidase [Microbispora sp. ATCC PTA-5024]